MTSPAVVGAGYARVAQGRWVVDCAGEYCRSALTLGPSRVDDFGETWPGLAWGQPAMRCWDCGFITTPVFWPPDPMAIQALLRLRPDPLTRNWLPHETLQDLLTENMEHGIMPPGLDIEGPTVAVMITVDERVIGGVLLDALPDADARRALTEGDV